jgi:hypothetical protein
MVHGLRDGSDGNVHAVIGPPDSDQGIVLVKPESKLSALVRDEKMNVVVGYKKPGVTVCCFASNQIALKRGDSEIYFSVYCHLSSIQK